MRLGLGLGVNSITSQKVGAGFTGILDEFTGAAAAYSVRKLSGTYSGDALRVRRSSDDTEQDIGFDANGDLDTTALLAFVGTGGTDNGYVTTFYDQTGNGNDATNSTESEQPQIVDGGTLVTENSKAAIDFDGDDLLQKTSASIDIAEGASLFTVLSEYTSGAAFSANSGGSQTSDEFLLWLSSSVQKFRYGQTPAGGVGVTETSSQQILTGIDDGDASLSVFQNSTTTNSGTSTTTVSAVDLLTIGARGESSLIYDGKIQKLIFFNSA